MKPFVNIAFCFFVLIGLTLSGCAKGKSDAGSSGGKVDYSSQILSLEVKKTTETPKELMKKIAEDKNGLSNLIDSIVKIAEAEAAKKAKGEKHDWKNLMRCQYVLFSVNSESPEIKDLIVERWDDTKDYWKGTFGSFMKMDIKEMKNAKKRKEYYDFLVKKGISYQWDNSFIPLLQNGDRILVKNETQIGGFEVVSQGGKPSQIEVKYWFSDDPKIAYKDVKAENKGTIKGMRIKFGTFDLDWSIRRKGIGYLSFDKKNPALQFASCPEPFEKVDLQSDKINFVNKPTY